MRRFGYTLVVALLFVLCIATNVWSQVGTAPSGSGTQASPFLIDSLDNLLWLQDYINRYTPGDYAKYYEQTADINASATSGWNSGQGFYPVGFSSAIFTGTYDGNGHTIDSLYINRTAQDKVGFLGDFSGTVKNLRLTNINITGYTNVGGLVGYCSSGTITNCSTTGAIGTGGQYLGGLVGEAINSTIDSCYTTVSFNSTSASLVGGFIGYSQETAISYCYSTGNITGSSGGGHIGGFVGENEGGSTSGITNCYATGNVTDNGSSSYYYGGFVGENYSGGKISECYSTGNVQAYSYIGGFVGENLASCVIKYSYSRGSIASNSGNVVGGFAGYIEGTNGTVDTCYSTGNVSGGSSMGGLVGANGGFVNNSFWDTTIAGLSSSGGGTGQSTTQMKTASTFVGAGWDASIWYMDGVTNDGYPYLAWQNPAGTPLPVELSALAASAYSTSVGLKWTTATETDNDGWEIERRNIDYGVWTEVGFVKGSGTSMSPRQYAFIDQNLAPGTYGFRLKQVNLNGSFRYSREVQIEVGTAPRVFTLSQNYPNPFNPTTTIEFTLPADGQVTLKVYDIMGREVATLLDGNRKAGEYQQVVFDGSRYSSGVYFAVLRSGGSVLLKKMLMVK